MLEGFQEVPVDEFGGLCTRIDRSDLPVGLSPRADNVQFFPGGCFTRAGLVQQVADGSRPGYIANAVAGFSRYDGTRRRLILTSDGALSSEYPEGTLGSVHTNFGLDVTSMKVAVYFDRAYIALGDGIHGVSRPRQWDNTNLWPLSQAGCVISPVGQSSQGGTAHLGYSTPGTHWFVLVFETTNGYFTQPSANASFVVSSVGGGNYSYEFYNIPLGPPNTLRRKIYLSIATSAGGSPLEYWTLPSMWINDNTSEYNGGPVFLFDALDTDLLAGELLGDALKPTGGNMKHRIPLPPVVGLVAYTKAQRLVGWGALNQIPRTLTEANGMNSVGLTGLNFDSGMAMPSSSGIPAGWLTHGSGVGGALATVNGAAMKAWQITGDGTATDRGDLKTSYAVDRLFDYDKSHTYNVRVRLKRSGGTAGSFKIEVLGGTPLVFAASSITTEWAWYSGQLFNATATGQVHIWANSLSNGAVVSVSDIMVYRSDQPYLPGRLFISDVNDVESFDERTGFASIAEQDGQDVRCCIEFGGALWAAKERALYVVTDTGDTPNNWTVEQFSQVVGTPSVHGMASGDRWFVVAGEAGLFLCDGGQPQVLTYEIQPDWDTINWAYGHRIWTAVDTKEKLVFVGAPTGSGTTPDTLFVMDYAQGLGDPMGSPGTGRKWAKYTFGGGSFQAYHGAYLERDSGARAVMVSGQQLTSNKPVVGRFDTSSASDTACSSLNGVFQAITSRYDTAPIGMPMGRSLFGYLAVRAKGAGTMTIQTIRPSGSARTTRTRTLASAPNNDMETGLHEKDTQVGVSIQTGAVNGDWFSVKRLSLYSKRAPGSVMRGRTS